MEDIFEELPEYSYIDEIKMINDYMEEVGFDITHVMIEETDEGNVLHVFCRYGTDVDDLSQALRDELTDFCFTDIKIYPESIAAEIVARDKTIIRYMVQSTFAQFNGDKWLYLKDGIKI